MNRCEFFAAIICAVVFEGSLSPIRGQVPRPAAPAPAAAAVPLKLPLTYVSAQTPADQLQLNSDNSFSLREADQTYHGAFSISGNILELRISETNSNTTATIQGGNLTDSSGQTWVLREQPAHPAPAADVVTNQDVISLVKAGLDDEIVIAKIGSSKCQFDTSPGALAQLRQSGVSAAVINTMVGSGTPPATSGSAASTLPAATPGVPPQAGLANASLIPPAAAQSIQPGPRQDQPNKTTDDLTQAEHVYTEVKLGRTKQPERFGDISLMLRGTDPENQTYSVDVMAGDKLTLMQNKNVNDLVEFYTIKGGPTPYNLLINQVTADGIGGYLWHQPVTAKLRGERNYTDVKLSKTNAPQRFGDVALRLDSVDPKRNMYSVEVFADDKLILKQDNSVNQPVQFYTIKGGDTPYELVIIHVTKDGIVGYLAMPKDTGAARILSPQPRSAYISSNPPAYKSPDANLRVPPNTTILDNFDGASAGRASGVQYVQIPGAQPTRRGASFSRKSDSRIEYPQGIPSEGTLEWWINVASGYSYQDFQLHTNQEQALIFSTDAQGGDVTWPGTAKLVVSVYGDVSFFLAANKFNQPPVQPMEPRGTPFRFNSWHAIGVSYGSQGEFIMVDGKVMGSAPKRTQTLGAAGNRTEPLDVPTIGQTVSHFWASHRYDGGFEGTVALFRASSAQKDWYLARGVAPDFRPPDFGSANQPVAQATPSAIPAPPDAGSTDQGTPVSSRVGPEAGPANSPRGSSLGPMQPAEGLLQNEDVIKMVKAGFDDALIIEKVGNSKCQFDTSADALIQLKQSGASGPVVRAVMEASAPRGLALTGRVVWNGLPVPNAKVRLAHRDSVSAPASARAVTAHDGAFTIHDPPAGDLMIWVYAPSSEYTDLIGRAVTITADNPENIGNVSITKKLQLLSPTISEIATTTPALEWARFPDSVRYNVYVFNDLTRQRILLRSTKDTRMTVPAPLPNGQQLRWGVQAYNSKGEEIAVSWWRFTIASPRAAADTSPDQHEPATLTQGPNARTQVTGRVAWNGIPVPNVQVQIKQDTGDSSRPVLASTVSAADGTFTIQEPPIGSLMIYALAPSTDYWSQAGRLITVMAGQPNNVGDVPLVHSPSGVYNTVVLERR